MRVRSLLMTGLVTKQLISANASRKNRVLHVGDSYAFRLGQTFETYCKGSEVVNAGIGGTNALEWSQYTQDEILVNGCDENLHFDEVYISVGGNDFHRSGCTMSPEELAKLIGDAVHNIVHNIAPGAKTYVIMGYCITPTPFVPNHGHKKNNHCADPGAAHPIDPSKIKVKMPRGSKLKIYDSAYVCGGTDSTPSNPIYFKDKEHLNAMGYCRMFMENPAVQESFRCEKQEPMDCENLDFKLYGQDQVCAYRTDRFSSSSKLASS